MSPVSLDQCPDYSSKVSDLIDLVWGPMVPVLKNPPANAGGVRDVGSIPGWERSLGGKHGSPLQYSCLENPMGRGTWWATVHRVAKSWL